VNEMLATTTSSEIAEWAAEYMLRNEDEERAYKEADAERQAPEGVAGVLDEDAEAEILRVARERGYEV
jgi:hypothetical protein